MNIAYFFKFVLKSCCIVAFIAAIIPTIFYFRLDESFGRFAVVVLTSSISICLTYWYLGLTKLERNKFYLLIKSKILGEKVW